MLETSHLTPLLLQSRFAERERERERERRERKREREERERERERETFFPAREGSCKLDRMPVA